MDDKENEPNAFWKEAISSIRKKGAILLSWRRITKSDIRKPETWWQERLVRNTKTIRNGLAALPAYTKFSVTRKYIGLSIESEPCPECGISLRISRVQYSGLEIWENDAGMPF